MSSRARGARGALGVVHQAVLLIAVSALTGVLVAGLAIPFAGLFGLGARGTAAAFANLPASLEQRPLPETTRVLAADGKLLATFYEEDREIVSLDEIDPTLQQAIIAIEDSRFYEHGAMDVRGTIRAFIANQASSGVVQGGSTITQQLVKMTLLQQADTRKERADATADTYARKWNELRYAVALEEAHTKRWILRRYLNTAYFGDGVYGVEAAARHYFSRSADNLKLRQAALLAGLVKNPSAYNPTEFRQQARERRDLVIQRMLDENMIAPSQARKARRANLGLDVTTSPNGCVSTKAPFFCDYLRRYLLDDPRLGSTVEDRLNLLNTGGLTIKTTLDLKMQRAADRSVARHVYPTDRAIGALALVQPGTGAVRAIAQSRPMGRDRRAGQTYLNYVVDQKYGDANGFQAGSTFKVFVLSAAIDAGIPLDTKIEAPQQIEIPQGDFRTCGGMYRTSEGMEPWQPANSTGAGTYDLYSGTRTSVNTFYAQLELRTGLCEPWKLAKAMGLSLTPLDRVPAFTLGSAAVSPLEMAEAYATFAARGIHCDAHPVTEVLDRDGNPIPLREPRCERVLRHEVADAVNDVLRGVQEPGGFGYGAGIDLDQVSAGKTGTTNKNMAVWFIGYTPNMAAASMIAGANSKGSWVTLNGQSLGGEVVASAFGSTLAGPMWYGAMNAIEKMLPNRNFDPPDLESLEGEDVEVPPLGGYSVETARDVLTKRGFFPIVVTSRVDSEHPAGTVAYTSPAAYETATFGGNVLIYVSDGSPYVPPKPPPTPKPPPSPPPSPSPSPSQPPNPSPTQPSPTQPSPTQPPNPSPTQPSPTQSPGNPTPPSPTGGNG